jgi:hypothetical protein
MSINSVSSISTLLDIQSVSTPSPSPASATDASAATSGVNVDISKPGQLMSELTALAQSDPTKFKSVTADIAKQLQDAASSQSGSSASFLDKLADKFSAASQSGSAADLAPSGKAHGHHHGGGGHHRVHASASDGSTAAPGAGPNDSVAQLVQGIISSALGTTSTSTSPST